MKQQFFILLLAFTTSLIFTFFKPTNVLASQHYQIEVTPNRVTFGDSITVTATVKTNETEQLRIHLIQETGQTVGVDKTLLTLLFSIGRTSCTIKEQGRHPDLPESPISYFSCNKANTDSIATLYLNSTKLGVNQNSTQD
ncbi:MAG: hypothetical protein HYY87_01745, partial [Candidatus Levybacteria bacterium]|nr:hypothetical protein [Candidatus Levybacteria bacterium]